MDERLWTRAELAQYLGISVWSVRSADWREKGPREVRVGGMVRYRPSDVMEWLDANAGHYSSGATESTAS